jgi:hypothetical protein
MDSGACTASNADLELERHSYGTVIFKRRNNCRTLLCMRAYSMPINRANPKKEYLSLDEMGRRHTVLIRAFISSVL